MSAAAPNEHAAGSDSEPTGGSVPPGSSETILIVDHRAAWYAQRLATAVPDARLRWSVDIEHAEPDLAHARGLATIGLPSSVFPLTADVIARMPKLEWLQCLIAGDDHALAALTDRPEIVLTTTRGVHGPQMAEAVITHMLVLLRRVKQVLRNQASKQWEQWPQPMLDGRTVGIVGLGASGRNIARVCKAFGMEVLAVSRSASAADGVDEIYGRDQLLHVAAKSDFLVLVLAAGPESEHLIDKHVLAAMKNTAFVINVARGSVLDEQALIEALRDNTIAGAGLDVSAVEPLPPESALWGFENVFITPHLGGRAERFAEQALSILEPNLRAFLSGQIEEMMNVVTR
jgi:phosphoglycerate dehydrogenase-like enzyme